MKVGVIVDNEYHSDVRVRREVHLLKALGHKVVVLCLSFKESYSYTEEGTIIHPLHMSLKIKNALYFFMNLFPIYEWWWTKKVKEFVKQYDVEVVHTHDLYMSKSVRKGINAANVGISMILDLHENYPHALQSYKWTQGFFRSLLVQPKRWLNKEGKYLSYADRIVVLSEDFKKALMEKYSFLKNDQLVVFPNVVDTDEFDKYEIDESVRNKLPNNPLVLYFGVVADRRGIFRSLKSCEELLNNGLNFSLLIIGPVDAGDKERFFNELEKPVLKKNVIYIPWIELSELPSYLHACDIALAPFDKNPQHESGIANKIFQYMYGKLPILASNCKPQQDLIEGSGIGQIFESDEELTQKLKWLIEHEIERKAMGEKAFNILMKEFHQSTFKPQVQALYEGLN